MSQTTISADGEETIVECDEFGCCVINRLDQAFIPAEHRQAVALALLGAPTPEMIERAAKWFYDRAGDWAKELQTGANYFDDDAESLLNAAFGLSE